VSPDDLVQLEALQRRNFRANLDRAELSSGFLSAIIPADTLVEMDKDLAVIVCVEGSDLLGFICASSLNYCKRMKLPAKMIERFDPIEFHGEKIVSLDGFIAGPVCVEKERRGEGIFGGLYDYLLGLIKDRFDLAYSLIDITNEPSLHAHQKVGYEIIDIFSHNGQEFYTVALALSRLYQRKRYQPGDDTMDLV
jgi:hypothetical protein